MSCDICGGKCAPYELVQLLSSYRTDKIEWICPACEKEVNRVLGEMKSAAHKWYSKMLKVFIRKKRIGFTRRNAK